jgi:hypothetical protein
MITPADHLPAPPPTLPCEARATFVALRPVLCFDLTLHRFLAFILHLRLVFTAGLGLTSGTATVSRLPAPWNVSLEGVASLGATAGWEHASPEHSTGPDGGAGKPPPIRAS